MQTYKYKLIIPIEKEYKIKNYKTDRNALIIKLENISHPKLDDYMRE